MKILHDVITNVSIINSSLAIGTCTARPKTCRTSLDCQRYSCVKTFMHSFVILLVLNGAVPNLTNWSRRYAWWENHIVHLFSPWCACYSGTRWIWNLHHLTFFFISRLNWSFFKELRRSVFQSVHQRKIKKSYSSWNLWVSAHHYPVGGSEFIQMWTFVLARLCRRNIVLNNVAFKMVFSHYLIKTITLIH